MKKNITAILVIGFVLFACASCLNKITYENRQKEHVWLMETLLPDGKDFKKLNYSEEDGIIHSVHQSSAGFVIETITQGYADEITMYIGVNNDGKVTGVVVYDAHETFGLGGKILYDVDFLGQFLNQTGTFVIGNGESDSVSGATSTDVSAGDEIYVDGISGATVSSKTVARCINAAIAYVTGADVDSSATS